MDIKDFYALTKDYSDDELEQIIEYADEMLASRHMLHTTYEDGFIDVMLKCGLDLFNAKMSLLDFKLMSAVYLQKTEPLFIEDIGQILAIVLHKNGYVPGDGTEQLLDSFIKRTFGRNIPSMAEKTAV